MGPWAPRHCRGCRWLVTPLITSLCTERRRSERHRTASRHVARRGSSERTWQ